VRVGILGGDGGRAERVCWAAAGPTAAVNPAGVLADQPAERHRGRRVRLTQRGGVETADLSGELCAGALQPEQQHLDFVGSSTAR
jgi:hypothetical protein